MDKAYHQLVFEAVKTAILVADDSDRIRAVNPGFLEILGQSTFTQDDFVGKELLSHPVLVEFNLCNSYQQLINGEAETITNVVIPQPGNDSCFNIYFHSYAASDTQENVYLFFHEDVTKLTAAMESAKMANDLLDEIQEVSGFGWWDLDIASQTATWSKQEFYILDYEPGVEKASSEKFMARIHPEDRGKVLTALEKPFQDKGPYASEFRLLLPGGKVRYVSEHGRVIFDKQGNGLHYLGTTIDVTHRVEAEQEVINQRDRLQELATSLEVRIDQRTKDLALKVKELSEAQSTADKANRAKSEFLSSMSHELRTPLNAILGFSQLLQMNENDGEKKENLGEIINAGNHLLDLVNEILDLSKVESGMVDISIHSCNVGELVKSCLSIINPFADTYSIQIVDNVTSSADFSINVDEKRFKQILLNILSNAVKYNSENGKIILDYSLEKENMLCLSVTDTGNGLTPEQQSRLFRPFERAGAENSMIEGTGLGLAINKDLIELMGGTIGVESERGEGSRFWIQVPLS